MTRLNSKWMEDLLSEFQDMNVSMKQSFGFDILELAAQAYGMTIEEIESRLKKKKVSIIPITAGEGVIGHFSESIAMVLQYMGCPVTITEKSDVAGFMEAVSNVSDIVFMGDDDLFMAMDFKSQKCIDNHPATAKGFAQITDQVLQSNKQNEVVVVGFGALGKLIADELNHKGYAVSVFDKNNDALNEADHKYSVVHTIKEHQCLVDATSEGDWLDDSMVNEKAIIIAPGVPISLSASASTLLKERYFHDYLAVGVAMMITALV